MARGMPLVEVADDRNPLGIRRPDGEQRAVHTIDVGRMRAQLVIQPAMGALLEQVDVLLAQSARGFGIPCFACRHRIALSVQLGKLPQPSEKYFVDAARRLCMSCGNVP